MDGVRSFLFLCELKYDSNLAGFVLVELKLKIPSGFKIKLIKSRVAPNFWSDERNIVIKDLFQRGFNSFLINCRRGGALNELLYE